MKTTIQYDDQSVAKEIYLSNREEEIERFNMILKSVEQVSTENLWSNFALVALLSCMRMQERFVEHIIKSDHKFAEVKKEKYMLSVFTKKTEELCGKEYKAIRKVFDVGDE
jgi:hypothetical protein